MAQALFHRQQHIGVAARLDVDHPVGMKPCEMERGSKQVAPAQAPHDRPIDPRENARKEDRRAGIVGKIGASSDLVERAASDTAAGEPTIEPIDLERDCRVPRTRALDLGDPRAQDFEDGGLPHGIGRLGMERYVPSLFHLWQHLVKLAADASSARRPGHAWKCGRCAAEIILIQATRQTLAGYLETDDRPI